MDNAAAAEMVCRKTFLQACYFWSSLGKKNIFHMIKENSRMVLSTLCMSRTREMEKESQI